MAELDPNADLTAEFMDRLRDPNSIENAQSAARSMRILEREGLVEKCPEFYARLAARARRVGYLAVSSADRMTGGETPGISAAASFPAEESLTAA